jgi:phosphohistidine phosphatase
MKTLLLMRHAKSDMNGKVEDRQRSLSKRGKKNAERMGELLKDEKVTPDLILASNANRARQTAELVIEAMKYQGDRCFTNRLYMAEVEAYAQEIVSLHDDVNSLLIIGHNPALETMLQLLTGKVESLPTAAAAQLKLPIDAWKDFNMDTEAELVNFWRPKEL